MKTNKLAREARSFAAVKLEGPPAFTAAAEAVTLGISEEGG
jgi:hypothetical protein